VKRHSGDVFKSLLQSRLDALRGLA